MRALRTNLEIRNKINEYDLYYYEVAEQMNIKPSNFSNMLRMLLSERDKEKIMEAIEKVHMKKENKNEQ